RLPMIARTHYRLTAAGACLLLAANLSAAGDALPRQPSPHFFPGRILRSNAPALTEQHAPANAPPINPDSLVARTNANRDERATLNSARPIETPPLEPR